MYFTSRLIVSACLGLLSLPGHAENRIVRNVGPAGYFEDITWWIKEDRSLPLDRLSSQKNYLFDSSSNYDVKNYLVLQVPITLTKTGEQQKQTFQFSLAKVLSETFPSEGVMYRRDVSRAFLYCELKPNPSGYQRQIPRYTRFLMTGINVETDKADFYLTAGPLEISATCSVGQKPDLHDSIVTAKAPLVEDLTPLFQVWSNFKKSTFHSNLSPRYSF